MLAMLQTIFFAVLLQVNNIDPGEAINSLRQNNAVVGILYFIVLVESAVIIRLWLSLNTIQKERIEDLKARIKAEEDLRKEIQEVYIKLNLENKKK